MLAKVTERVRELRTVAHPSVLTPVGLGVTEEDQVVVRFPWLDGVDLAELETRRGPLSAGESVWLGVRLAQALERMHAAGLAHGDVSPGNVVITDGSVVLVDTVAGCLEDEQGTVGFRAPERDKHGASAAGDVFSLGALLRWCVADDQRVAIEAWTAPLLMSDPAARPPVDVARRALASCAPEQQVTVPARSELVTAVRARATERTVRLAAGRTRSWHKLGLRVGLGIAIAGALSAMVIAVPRFVDAAKPAGANAMQHVHQPAGKAGVSESPAPSLEPAKTAAPRLGPAEAAVALTQQRFEALASGDGMQLRTTVGQGALGDEVEALANALTAGEVTYEELDVDIGDAEVITELSDSAVVHVAYDISDHVVTTPAGEQRVAAHSQKVELELSWDGAWTVQSARPTP